MALQEIKTKNLRILAIGVLTVLFLILLSVSIIGLPELNTNYGKIVSAGYVSLEKFNLRKTAVELNGNWECFDGVFLEEPQLNREKLHNGILRQLPIGNVTEAAQSVTYRVFVETGKNSGPLGIYLPTNNENFTIYVNGTIKKSLGNQYSKSFSITNSITSLEEIEAGLIEIVISVNKTKGNSVLYKHPVILGNLNLVLNLAFWTIANTLFIVGMIIFLLINSYIFMVIMPEHRMISLITLFDSAIMFRLIFGMDLFLYFLQYLLPGLKLTDTFCFSSQIFFLMTAGFIGCHLSGTIFDPEKKTSKKITYGISIPYLIFAFVFSFDIKFFEKIGKPLMLVIFILSFIMVFIQMTIALKRERSPYIYFQSLKTSYIGIVILWDILSLNSATNIFLLTYLYTIFFLAHIVARLYDNNISYKNVAKLNMHLERTVEERTKELVWANARLKELSIRDPLTGAYNRLYFELQIEKILINFNPKKDIVHLCMFDLDFFKIINDSFGHDAGDEQLKELVQIVLKKLPKDSFLARIGGEEFAILFYGDSTETVSDTVEIIRRCIEKNAEENTQRTTASFGLVKYQNMLTQKDFLKAADKCLYEAKNQGRNKTVSVI